MQERRYGATKEQMRAAPEGAVFVWPNNMLGYPRALARSIGRKDLRVVPPSFLSGCMWRGMAVGVVIDHATTLDMEQKENYKILRNTMLSLDK